MASSRNQRLVADHQAADYISNLPDTILCYILSFVPTKSAVKTSILSQRWKYLWSKVPVLDFNEMPDSGSFYSLTLWQKTCFKTFVDRVLLHNDASYLQHLRLDLRSSLIDDDFYIKTWLRAISSREIQEIRIRCFWPQRKLVLVVLPTMFLWSSRLVVLELWGTFTVSYPMFLHLPNLEIAHLFGFQIPDDEFMKRFLSACPVLKELRISECKGITNTLHVESLTLKILDIRGTMAKTQQARIVIKAPNLLYFRLVDTLRRHVIGELSSLVEADLDFEGYNYEYALELVKKVCGAKILSLESTDGYEYISKPLIFHNLTCLKIVADKSVYIILESAPKLKSLAFLYIVDVDTSFESRPVPKCLSSLEHVEFDAFEFSLRYEEISFVAYFLKVGSILKEVKICFSRMSTEHERDVCQKLLTLPRSSACEVKVFYSSW